jgi:[acyl-carrier-protein] S-malonyltransferase
MLVLLCGGQGDLSPTMFELSAQRPEAAAIFAEAQALLGRGPRELVRDADEDQLTVNHTSQLLSATAALAAHACVAEALREPVATAGYSVGEMAAWSIAGVWTPQVALRLTDVRARAMDAAGGAGGHLGYVRGLDRRVLETLLARCEPSGRGVSLRRRRPALDRQSDILTSAGRVDGASRGRLGISRHPRMNARRSGLTTSAWIVNAPCG